MEMIDLSLKEQKNSLKLLYDFETESFITRIDTTDNETSNKIISFFQKIDKEMTAWQKKFFIIPRSDKSFTFCPGVNIEQVLFQNGLYIIDKKKLDLYTLQWLFSIAMGLYVLHSKDIEYFNLCNYSVFIDSKFNARLGYFGYSFDNNASDNSQYIFYPPEKNIVFGQKKNNVKFDKNQSKMADIYMYGVLFHEIVTRLDQHRTYFDVSEEESFKKIESGAINYMDLKNRNDVPFFDLLLNCLDPDPQKRWTIDKIVKYLLNVKHVENQYATVNDQYFNINNVNIDQYHQFIQRIFGFDQNLSFNECKNDILNMIDKKEELQHVIPCQFTSNNYCTFDDLKEGYENGLSYCINVVDCCLKKLGNELENYYKFRFKNPQVNEFDLMKAFMSNINNKDNIWRIISNLRQTVYDEYIECMDHRCELPMLQKVKYDCKKDTFFIQIITNSDVDFTPISDFFSNVERMEQWQKNFFVVPERFYINQSFTFCPGDNIYSFLFQKDHKTLNKSQIDLYKLEWLFSIAMGMHLMHLKNIDFNLSDKSILIDSKMHARIINLPFKGKNKNSGSSVVAYPYKFYSPELLKIEKAKTFNNQTKELKSNEKIKSNIFTFGLIANELLTNANQSLFFENNPLEKMISQYESGVTELLKLDEKNDVPLKDLLYGCLNSKPEERWGMPKIISSILNLDPKKYSESPKNQDFLDLSKIDFDIFHNFIINALNIDPKTDFETAKNQINDFLNGKTQLRTILKETHNTCSFQDLKDGELLGISSQYLFKNLTTVLEKYCLFDKYKDFTAKNQNLNKYDIMKIFFQHINDEEDIDKELSGLLAANLEEDGHFVGPLFDMDNHQNIFKKFESPEFIEIPYEIESHSELEHVVQPESNHKNRIKNYPYLNLYNIFYNHHPILKNVKISTRIDWLYSIAQGIKEIHENGRFMLNFSSKNVYIDEKLKAKLFMPRTITNDSFDLLKLFQEQREKIEKFENQENKDISIYYDSPELFNNNVKNIDLSKCDIYSFGVIAKEIIEHNIPWISIDSLSPEQQLDALAFPRWGSFSSSFLNFFNKTNKQFDDQSIIKALNNCLNYDPKNRGTIKEVCDCFRKFFDSHEEKFVDNLNYQNKVRNISKRSDYDQEKIFPKKSKSYFIDKDSFLEGQLNNINSKVLKLQKKLMSKNLIIGSVSPRTVKQIIIREIKNPDWNLELSVMLNNSIGDPSLKSLNMKKIDDSLIELKNENFISNDIKHNKRGDPVFVISQT